MQTKWKASQSIAVSVDCGHNKNDYDAAQSTFKYCKEFCHSLQILRVPISYIWPLRSYHNKLSMKHSFTFLTVLKWMPLPCYKLFQILFNKWTAKVKHYILYRSIFRIYSLLINKPDGNVIARLLNPMQRELNRRVTI